MSDERIENSVRAYREGEDRALAVGAVAAAAALAIYFAPQVAAATVTWAALHPEFLEAASNALVEMSTGGPGGGGTFVTGSLEAGEAAILQNAASGRAFEQGTLGLLGAAKNTERILTGEATGAAYRIPDILDHISKTLGEIKGVKDLSLTTQLDDFITYCRDTGYSFNLYVRPDTTLTEDLVDALKEIGAKVYDVVDGQFVERVLE
jgi:hypothetical protein